MCKASFAQCSISTRKKQNKTKKPEELLLISTNAMKILSFQSTKCQEQREPIKLPSQTANL